MGFSGNIINRGIKLVGNLAQGSSEATGILIGTFKEKVLKQPGEKDKFSVKGRIKGRVLKRDIDKVGDISAVVVDKGVDNLGKGVRNTTIIVLKGLNKMAKVAYEGTEKLKNSFDEYNKSKEFLSDEKNNDKKINDINMTIVEDKNMKEFIDINKNYYEYDMEVYNMEELDKEKYLGKTGVMDKKDILEIKNKL